MAPVMTSLLKKRLRPVYAMATVGYAFMFIFGGVWALWVKTDWDSFFTALLVWLGFMAIWLLALAVFQVQAVWWQPYWRLLPISGRQLFAANLLSGMLSWLLSLLSVVPLAVVCAWHFAWRPTIGIVIAIGCGLLAAAFLFCLVSAFVLAILAIKDRFGFAPMPTVLITVVGIGILQVVAVQPLKQLLKLTVRVGANAVNLTLSVPSPWWLAFVVVIGVGLAWGGEWLLGNLVEVA